MLDDATFLLSHTRHRSAVDRAYYAMFHSSQAALAGTTSRQPKSHGGLRAVFGQNLVQPGKVEPVFADHLSLAFRLRQRSTYDPDFSLEGDRADVVVAAAAEFLTRMRRLVEENR